MEEAYKLLTDKHRFEFSLQGIERDETTISHTRSRTSTNPS
jgi:hypothetical protein